jgi:hypothetical protein
MGFFSNLFNLSPTVEQPPLNQPFYIKLDGKSKVLDENYFEWYKKNPFVFTAINERAKAVANCIFYIKDKDGNLIENDLTKKLNNPNSYLSRNEFVLQLMIFKGIWGTGYLYLNRLRPSEKVTNFDFLNIPTNQILFGDKTASALTYDFLMDELKRETENKIDIYYSALDGLQKKILEKENLLPFFDSTVFTNKYYSESRLRSQRYVVSNIQAALETENTFLSTPAGMGMLVPDSKDASGSVALLDNEKEEVERQLQNEYGSLTGQRNIRLVNSPLKYIETMVDFQKLKLTESLQRNALILFGAYGLPKELLTAMMQGSTFENQKTAYRNFIQSTAQIEADSIANSIDLAYPSREGKLVADFNHLPILQENEKERAQVDKTNAEAQKIERETWDAWLTSGYVNQAQYKEHFKL